MSASGTVRVVVSDTSRSQRSPYTMEAASFPDEIWMEIFEYAIDEPTHPAKHATAPHNFSEDPTFARFPLPGNLTGDYMRCLRSSKTRSTLIALVCRRWYHISLRFRFNSFLIDFPKDLTAALDVLNVPEKRYSYLLTNLTVDMDNDSTEHEIVVGNILNLCQMIDVVLLYDYGNPFRLLGDALLKPLRVTTLWIEAAGQGTMEVGSLWNFLEKLPAIRSFGLLLGATHVVRGHGLEKRLKLDQLSTLYIYFQMPSSILDIWEYFLGCLMVPTLTSLVLKDSNMPPILHTKLFKPLSNLTRLHIDLMLLLGLGNEVILLPCLKHLHLKLRWDILVLPKEVFATLDKIITLDALCLFSLVQRQAQAFSIVGGNYSEEYFSNTVVVPLFTTLLRCSPNLAYVFTDQRVQSRSPGRAVEAFITIWKKRFADRGIEYQCYTNSLF